MTGSYKDMIEREAEMAFMDAMDANAGEANMASIEIKRVYEPRSRDDGERILVDRLWPRGLRKESAHINLWEKNIAPTPSLRTWFDHRADRFAEFKRRY